MMTSSGATEDKHGSISLNMAATQTVSPSDFPSAVARRPVGNRDSVTMKTQQIAASVDMHNNKSCCRLKGAFKGSNRRQHRKQQWASKGAQRPGAKGGGEGL